MTQPISASNSASGVEKSMYGKSYMGIQRASFVIDEQGMIAGVWPKVKVPGHAEEVLAFVTSE